MAKTAAMVRMEGSGREGNRASLVAGAQMVKPGSAAKMEKTARMDWMAQWAQCPTIGGREQSFHLKGLAANGAMRLTFVGH